MRHKRDIIKILRGPFLLPHPSSTINANQGIRLAAVPSEIHGHFQVSIR